MFSMPLISCLNTSPVVLDVWLPNIMTGSLQYVSDVSYPKILALDFTDLRSVDLNKLIDREGLTFRRSVFSCEEALEDITLRLSAHDK